MPFTALPCVKLYAALCSIERGIEGKMRTSKTVFFRFELEYGSRCIWDTDATKVQFYRVVTEALRNKVLSSLALEKEMGLV